MSGPSVASTASSESVSCGRWGRAATRWGMIRNHHELWDGRGYPDGLAGDNIPQLARLLQVADSYDAMISDRPYQPAMSEQEVLAHLRQHAGELYDPVAVGAVCAVVGEGRAEYTSTAAAVAEDYRRAKAERSTNVGSSTGLT